MRIIEVEPIVLRIRKLDTERRTEPRTFFLVRVHTEQETVGIGEADTSPYVARTIIEEVVERMRVS